VIEYIGIHAWTDYLFIAVIKEKKNSSEELLRSTRENAHLSTNFLGGNILVGSSQKCPMKWCRYMVRF
jgi:hypothetical protein